MLKKFAFANSIHSARTWQTRSGILSDSTTEGIGALIQST